MPLFTIGLNHRTAPIEVRERVAFPTDAQRPALEALKTETSADEITLISTCIRTEIYVRAADAGAAERAGAWLAAHPGVNLRPHLYQLTDADVTRHVFRVASGLDSMILGEPQILGQVKLAVKIAAEAGMLGGPLDRLFQDTFKVAKQVRTDTAIGATSVSMAAAALKLAQQLFGDLRDTRLLLIGAGEMIELAAAHFTSTAPKSVVVANRTLEKGRELAARFQASAITLQQLPERIHEFDIVISSTASTLPIIGKGMVESALKLRKHRPMFMVDLAVPRDIEPEAADLDDVYLYTVDDLGGVVQEGRDARNSAVAQAEAIIDTRVQGFMHWLDARSSAPLVTRLREQADALRDEEMQRALKALEQGKSAAAVIEALSRALTNKLMHAPTVALSQAAPAERAQTAQLIQTLYKL